MSCVLQPEINTKKGGRKHTGDLVRTYKLGNPVFLAPFSQFRYSLLSINKIHTCGKTLPTGI
jgi:hypothetical protein